MDFSIVVQSQNLNRPSKWISLPTEFEIISIANNAKVSCRQCWEKRRRAAALQDAGALADALEPREASWSAPLLWRFEKSRLSPGRTELHLKHP
jgi:hypothetical protein